MKGCSRSCSGPGHSRQAVAPGAGLNEGLQPELQRYRWKTACRCSGVCLNEGLQPELQRCECAGAFLALCRASMKGCSRSCSGGVVGV